MPQHTSSPRCREYLENLRGIEYSLWTEEQLDDEAEAFVDNIQQAAWNNISKINPRTNGNIRELISEKRRLRRIWQQCGSLANKSKPNNGPQQLKRDIQKVKNNYIRYYLS